MKSVTGVSEPNARIAATFVNSSLEAPERRKRLAAAVRGDVDLLYVTPERFRDLEVGVDFYSFWKQKKSGPVSDFRANVATRELGHEVDIYANWRLLSDLSVMLRYGRFWTGDGLSDGEKRDFMYAGLVYSF